MGCWANSIGLIDRCSTLEYHRREEFGWRRLQKRIGIGEGGGRLH